METLHFRPNNIEGTLENGLRLGVGITIVGSKEKTKEENLEAYGELVADKIANQINKAKQENKKIVFDMATGSTPKAVWPHLDKLIQEKKVDLSNVIIMGHEEAWGNFEPGSKSDFDAYRRNLLERNKEEVKPILDSAEVAEGEIEKNFIPMHLVSANRSDFPEGEEGDNQFFEAEKKASSQSAEKYEDILDTLRKRSDITFFGLYGVGTDGHVGEFQISTMGRETLDRRNTYNDSIQNYSIERGLFYWQNEDGSFAPENNVFWQRGAKQDEAVGRASWQGYASIHEAIGIGWKDVLKEDVFTLIFNDESKSLAFQLALEGSFSGTITNEQGEVLKIEQQKGEGEKILGDLENYATQLENDGLLEPGTVEKNRTSEDSLKCRGLFKEIYAGLDRAEAQNNDPRYEQVWKFINRYLGKRSPVSRLINLRRILGKETEIIATPEVVKNTKYEQLAK